MNKSTLTIALCAILCLGFVSPDAQARKRSSKKKDTVEQADSTKTEKKDKYAEAIKDAKVYPGLFKLYLTPKEKLLFEFTPENFNHLYLLTNRMTETSSDAAFAAGELLNDPVMIRMQADTSHLHFYLPDDSRKVRPGDEITEAYHKNHREPIVKSFDIKAFKGDSLYLVDMTDFFQSNDDLITPLQYSQDIMSKPSGSYDSDGSRILEVKSFPENVEISSQINFHNQPKPYLVKMRRSILLLPDEPMKMRYQDNRVGYFHSMYDWYTSDEDNVPTRKFIHRWRLEPKEEDMEKYFNGELVEPAKPIVFYIDSAFPAKWKAAVKAGVQDWQKAFEEAGFKNAIIAYDYPDPADSTGFDPDDIRFNCIRYVVTDIANANGPSYVDPRSGEILVADVNWYHNVISLVNNWKFCQTAAVDPRVRKLKMDDDVMNESLRYVASHEVGHTLGLMHNMGASWAFPVDSLRSPSFTQKYGTTPSIMDYARNNYIAQPGDMEKGVRMVPPLVGVYDKYAINWGYRLFPGELTPEQEKPLLNEIVKAKYGDPMYEFGAQQVFKTISPADQTEDLGNDHIKAGDYAISNIKIIVKNMEKWLYEEGADYMDIKIKYYNLANQYRRHLNHVFPYVGGLKFHDFVQGDGSGRIKREYIDKDTQKRAMNWLVNQVLTFREWLLPKNIMDITGYGSGDLDSYQRSVAAKLFTGTTLTLIAEGERSGQKNLYTLDEYLKDAVDATLVTTLKHRNLTIEDMNLQNSMVAALASLAGLIKGDNPAADTSSYNSALADTYGFSEDLREMEKALALMDEECASESYCSYSHASSNHLNSYYRQNNDLPKLSGALVRPAALKQLQRVLKIYKSSRNSVNERTRSFYNYQIDRVERAQKSSN